MLGYMTAREALTQGFTHHGAYFGIPLWMGDVESDAPMVCTKWMPLEYLMSVFHFVEGFLHMMFWPHDEPCFQFALGQPIEVSNERD